MSKEDKEWFESRLFSPMLIKEEVEPFSSDDYLYELKFDGARTLIYVKGNRYNLINKRKVDVTDCFPEFQDIFASNKHEMVLDSEVICLTEDGPNFQKVARRLLTRDKYKIERLSRETPGALVVFDCLYLDGKSLIDEPLIKRKEVLHGVIKTNEYLYLSEYVIGKGFELLEYSKEHNLEGVVAKERDSLYYNGKRTGVWKKIKNMKEDDFVLGGYKTNEVGYNYALGQYSNGKLRFVGHVVGYKLPPSIHRQSKSPFEDYSSSGYTWLKPEVVLVARFMERTKNKHLRQPVFKGFRDDKEPKDCKYPP